MNKIQRHEKLEMQYTVIFIIKIIRVIIVHSSSFINAVIKGVFSGNPMSNAFL